MSPPVILALLSGLALFIVVLRDFLDALLAVLELLFLRAALLVGGWLVAMYLADRIEVSWLAPGDGSALATTGLLWALIVIIVRHKIADERETAELMRIREEKARVLAERGRTVVGRVIAIERTGSSLNDNPEVRFSITATLQNGNEITITHERYVDLLQVPQFQPGRRVEVRYDPENPDNHELSWDEDAPAASPTGTGAPFAWPLWLFGQENAEQWLLPARDERQPPVVIVDISDPHDATAGAEREVLVDMAAFVLAEQLWMRTDAAASAAVLVDVDNKRLIQPVGELADFESLLPFVRSLERAPVLAWGAALADLDREGVRLQLRLPGDEVARSLSGPLPELAEMLIDWLVRRGLCRRIEPPAWWAVPGPEVAVGHARVLHDLQLQILADAKNEALAPLSGHVHASACEQALALARAHGEGCPQLRLLAAVVAMYAARAEQLPARLRSAAVELVLAEKDPSSALYRLSPHLLRQLGDTLAAHSRSSAIGASAEGDYRAWLRRTDAL